MRRRWRVSGSPRRKPADEHPSPGHPRRRFVKGSDHARWAPDAQSRPGRAPARHPGALPGSSRRGRPQSPYRGPPDSTRARPTAAPRSRQPLRPRVSRSPANSGQGGCSIPEHDFNGGTRATARAQWDRRWGRANLPLRADRARCAARGDEAFSELGSLSTAPSRGDPFRVRLSHKAPTASLNPL
jgi:hypothetical protein